MHHLYIIYVLIPQALRYLLAGLCIEYVMIKCLLHTQLLIFLGFIKLNAKMIHVNYTVIVNRKL